MNIVVKDVAFEGVISIRDYQRPAYIYVGIQINWFEFSTVDNIRGQTTHVKMFKKSLESEDTKKK